MGNIDINTVIAVVSALVAIGVSWGITTTKIEGLQKEINAMAESQKDLMHKDHCALKHDFVDRSIAEIKADLREIKDMLRKMTDRNNKMDG